MKVLGGFTILVATILALTSYFAFAESIDLRRSLDGKSSSMTHEIENFMTLGLASVSMAVKTERLEAEGKQYAIAAVVIGLVGMWFWNVKTG